MGQLFDEFKRLNVFGVGIAFLVAAQSTNRKMRKE